MKKVLLKTLIVSFILGGLITAVTGLSYFQSDLYSIGSKPTHGWPATYYISSYEPPHSCFESGCAELPTYPSQTLYTSGVEDLVLWTIVLAVPTFFIFRHLATKSNKK